MVPRAEKAIAEGNADGVIDFIVGVVKGELMKRFERVEAHRGYDVNDVGAAREYVQAELGFVLFSHHLYEYVKSGGGHGEEGKHEHGE